MKKAFIIVNDFTKKTVFTGDKKHFSELTKAAAKAEPETVLDKPGICC